VTTPYEPPFVNREGELSILLKIVDEGYYPVLYLFGPEGCGKTRLLKEVLARIRGEEDYFVVYVDAQSAEDLRKAILAPPRVLEIMAELVKEIGGPVGRAASLIITKLASRLGEHEVKGRKVVILLDDIARPLGIDMIEIYTKNLLTLLEELYALKASSVSIIATTSEGASCAIVAKHNYVRLRQIWNLDKDSTHELLAKLNAPQKVWDDVWRLTGGNPRSIVELWRRKWKIDEWIKEVEISLRIIIRQLDKSERRFLKTVVTNVDAVQELPQLRRALIENNLITPIVRPCLGYTPPPCPELGIGEDYAWQIPVYKYIVERMRVH